MSRFISGAVGIAILLSAVLVLSMPAKASLCFGPQYSVTASFSGLNYSYTYSKLLNILQKKANYYNGNCRSFGTCEEQVEITNEYEIDGIYYIEGREDFRCMFDF